MYIKKNNASTLRYSKMRSSSITMLPKKKDNSLRSPRKPSCVSKRSVSLPSKISKSTVKTRKLFWFIPADHKQQRRSNQWARERIQPFQSSGSENASYFEAENTLSEKPLVLNEDIPESVALEWITTSSTHLSEEDDDLDGPLFGLEFVDSWPEKISKTETRIFRTELPQRAESVNIHDT